MKHIGKIALTVTMLVNALFIGLLLLAAYSPYINPQKYPLLSCMGLTFPIFLFINGCFLFFWMIFRSSVSWFPLVGFLLCLPQIITYVPFRFSNPDIPENNIKLLTYNVMNFGGLQKVEGGNPILNYIRDSGADIICMQEFVPSGDKKRLTQKDFDDALKAYPCQAIYRIGNSKGNGTACYSKYPILSSRPLAFESQSNGSVLYEIKIGKDTLTLINNHLESNKLTVEDRMLYQEMLESPEASRKMKQDIAYLLGKLKETVVIRAKQAKTVSKEISQSPHKYIVVCGDFNDSPISYSHRFLTQQLDDAFTQSGRGLGISYNRNRFYFRIDHILISKNLQSYRCTVDRSIRDSDHYPMWCYISKKD
ncbi:MAG: endonuclease/exonuclease/phosphatase family protein [Bacteroides sp.]|nr:endonuclease/exonuclease/phosphatase family protein [Bacteroides sp.]